MTSDGDRRTIHNGLIEWIYECKALIACGGNRSFHFSAPDSDEIFQRNLLLFWSPNDRYFAFIKINLTQIPSSFIQRYDNDEPYRYPYAKYQDPLPSLDVFVHHLKSGRTLRVPRPSAFEKFVPSFRRTTNVFRCRRNSTLYIYHVVWYCSNCLSIVYGDRDERSSLIQCYEISPDRIVAKAFFQQPTKHNAFLSRYVKPYFASNGTYAFLIQFNPLANDDPQHVKFSPRLVRINWNQRVMFARGGNQR